MKVTFEHDPDCGGIEVTVRYAVMNGDVRRVKALINSAAARVPCAADGKMRYIGTSEIYYIESVDKRTFVYCAKEVFRTELRLYRLADELSGAGFVQISKSCVLNVNVLDSVKPLLNSRMEATLINGERLYITRKYLPGIKRALEMEKNL